MSTAEAATEAVVDTRPDYVVVIGHSNLFYWWPVWVLGFLMAALTSVDGHRMAVLPADAEIREAATVDGVDGPRTTIVLPPKTTVDGAPAPVDAAGEFPNLLVARTNNYGVIFLASILFCVIVSNITFRGLVSVILLISLIVAVLMLALLDWWDEVLVFLGGLDVRINAGGYLALAVPLFAAWLFTTFVYDRQHYIIFDQGQIRFVREIGDGETVMDAHGAVVEKKRDDILRHWLVGLGSGDLRVRTGGSNGQTFEIENVLGVSRKLRMIHQMLQERKVSAVVAAPLAG